MFAKYNFAVVRSLRRRIGLTLEQLAKRSGLTYPTVAAIETNKTLPAMRTLDALAGALQMSASGLLALAEKRVVQVRKALPPDAHAPRPGRGRDKLRLAQYDNGKLIRVRASSGETIHVPELHEQCHEMCYVLAGRVRLTVDDQDYELEADDTILFDGVLEHRYTMIETGEFITVHIPKDIRVIEALLDSMIQPSGEG